jgi:glycosyltransferase involved in cell wall biosynthesis
MPIISIVIPVYNKTEYIKRALRSVFSQTVTDFALLVVDDGSTDGGGAIVSGFTDPRLKLIRQENQGVCAARNTGIAASRTDLIAFLDADDEWYPQFLETILRLKEKFPRAGAYATAYKIFYTDGSVKEPDFQFFPAEQQDGIIDNYFKAAPFIPVSSSSVAVRKNVLEEIGGFPIGETNGEDLDTWLKVAIRHPIAWTREWGAIWHNEPRARYWTGEPQLSKTARRAIEEGMIPADKIKDLQEYVAGCQLRAAKHCLEGGKRDIALQLLEYARGTRSLSREWWECWWLARIPNNLTPRLWKSLRKIKQIMKQF